MKLGKKRLLATGGLLVTFGAAQIATLKNWIAGGAAWPDDAPTAKPGDWWSFQPLKKPALTVDELDLGARADRIPQVGDRLPQGRRRELHERLGVRCATVLVRNRPGRAAARASVS